MSLTSFLKPLLLKRCDPRMWDDMVPQQVQLNQLRRLLSAGADTLWGHQHGYSPSMSYDDFRRATPVTDYESLRPLIERMIAGEASLLWPGVTRRYAQSSGTTGGKSKYVPITDDSLRECHYRGGNYSVSQYLNLYPSSHIFEGKSFILGGSYANTLNLPARRVKVGDLSATLIDCINPLVNLTRVPSKRIALLADWDRKLPALVDAGLHANVTNIAGVPSWFLTVLKQMIATAGVRTIHDIWPNLEVFFHGGIAFGPYRSEYDAITEPGRMRYLETYNASEGFFGVQASATPGPLMLLLDCGVFYELLPLGAETGEAIPAWMAETGKVYELIITSCNGLWRYRLGDTVRIHSTRPLTFTIEGRTKAFINAFGEELMVHNADRAIARACRETHSSVADYTAAPVYTHGNSRGRHQWIIEFNETPGNLDDFTRRLDRALRDENSDYDAKRSGDIFLAIPEVIAAPPGLFDRWLASTGKRGGQRKVPRLCNNRSVADQILALRNQ